MLRTAEDYELLMFYYRCVLYGRTCGTAHEAIQAAVIEAASLRSRICTKVKLICFVDTLMALTSVNVKPALLFSPLEEFQPSIMFTLCEGQLAARHHYAGFESLRRRWAAQTEVLLSHTQQFFCGGSCWAALLLTCDLQVSCVPKHSEAAHRAQLAALYSEQSNVSFRA